jgi:hypothetical protein
MTRMARIYGHAIRAIRGVFDQGRWHTFFLRVLRLVAATVSFD